jgi:hypothetical protein
MSAHMFTLRPTYITGGLGALGPQREVQEGWPSCCGVWGASAHNVRERAAHASKRGVGRKRPQRP